ncbi:hypothetical protein [Methylophilus sp. 3sh_L]|uniref:hypothetical protein n=1 Tax=Methylophilus sp. 3sh_L TaxID=3377114 RepID=UPI00398F46D1
MKVNTESNHFYTTQSGSTPSAATIAASFKSALSAATAEASSPKQSDFTGMTRKEMFDWMNEQIRSGKMSLDESSPFLGMTMKVSVATGQPVDMATDTTRINFIEKARLGIEGARSNNDPDLAKRLQVAIDVMLKQQG